MYSRTSYDYSKYAYYTAMQTHLTNILVSLLEIGDHTNQEKQRILQSWLSYDFIKCFPMDENVGIVALHNRVIHYYDYKILRFPHYHKVDRPSWLGEEYSSVEDKEG